MKVAIPTLGKGGLDCERSGHFGHCDCFTVVDVEDGQVGAVSVIGNPPHEEGGCMRPVALLADNGIDAIVAAGMGMRPMMGFAQAGITEAPTTWEELIDACQKLKDAGIDVIIEEKQAQLDAWLAEQQA